MASISSQKYVVTWRVNGYITAVAENLTAAQVYTEGVPGEALYPTPGNRWHVMMRQAAMERMEELWDGEEFMLAWQDLPLAGSGLDTEEILVRKVIA